MKNKVLFILFMLSIGLNAQNAPYASNRIIAGLKNDLNESITDLRQVKELDFLFTEYSINTIKPLDISPSKSLNGRPLVLIFNDAITIDLLIQKLQKSNLFDYVEPDYVLKGSGEKVEENIKVVENKTPFNLTPNDQYFFRQWGLHNDGSFSLSPSTVDADVDMIEAWEISTGSSNVIMAVIDSGIRMSHPEFSGRFHLNNAEILNGLDTDNNGYIDDLKGWDFVNNDNDPTDDHGHGTNVTGIAMANGNNTIGYAGVDWNCKLLPLKVLNNNNSGFTSNFIASIYYAINRNVDLISISIGGTGFSSAYQNVIDQAYSLNIPVIACMMNFNNNVAYYPAAFTNTIAVGSTNPNDTRTNPFFWSTTSGSNYGSHIDVVAPGNFMYGLSYTSDTSYGSYWGGTSQATPLVAGIVSLMLSIKPNLTVDEIRTILSTTAQDLVGNPIEDTLGWDQYYGAGRVNAYNALTYVQNLSNTDFDLNNLVKIHPNPVKNTLYISSSTVLTDSFSVSIYDVTGRFIKGAKEVVSTIDVSDLNNGVYFVTISKNNELISRKFIKE
jgi:subtilisin family serine protease